MCLHHHSFGDSAAVWTLILALRDVLKIFEPWVLDRNCLSLRVPELLGALVLELGHMPSKSTGSGVVVPKALGRISLDSLSLKG